MRVVEIDDQDRSFLTLKGIKFDFKNEYNNVVSAFSIVGKSANRRQILRGDIDFIISLIVPFLNYGFPTDDLDIIEAQNIHNELLKIKNQL